MVYAFAPGNRHERVALVPHGIRGGGSSKKKVGLRWDRLARLSL